MLPEHYQKVAKKKYKKVINITKNNTPGGGNLLKQSLKNTTQKRHKQGQLNMQNKNNYMCDRMAGQVLYSGSSGSL